MRVDRFVVLRSPEAAEDRPLYQELASFKSQQDANAFAASLSD
jgi:hypothetical protein